MEKKDENDEKNDVISLKQAKFDVFKYGIKGFEKERQEDAQIQMAIKLGAKVITFLLLSLNCFRKVAY